MAHRNKKIDYEDYIDYEQDQQYYPEDDQYYQEQYYPEGDDPYYQEVDGQEQIEEKPKKEKKKKKNSKPEPDEAIVESLFQFFEDMDLQNSKGMKKSELNNISKVTRDQIKQQLIASDLDADQARENLLYNKKKKEGKGQKVKPQSQNKTKEREVQIKEMKEVIDQKVPRAMLNAEQPDMDYGVKIDKEVLQKDINMVIFGHVDSGKSTLTGSLLYQYGKIKDHDVNKISKLTEQYGKATFEMAFFMDQDEEERKHGVTINVAKAFFQTANRNVIVLDSPGHKDFIPNMIQGAAQADCGILVLDARKGAYESSMSPSGSTKAHIMIARSVGITQLVVAVNKLDAVEIDWSEERYDYICNDIIAFLQFKAGFNKDRIMIVPISGYQKINLDTRDSQPDQLKAWYNDESAEHNPYKVPRCLVEAIDQFKAKKRPINRPLRASIYDIYQNLQDGFNVVQGDCLSVKIESGVIKKRDRLLLMPLRAECDVKSIEYQGQSVDFAYSGQLCELGVSFPQSEAKAFMNVGQILCDPAYPCYQVKKFKANVLIFKVNMVVTMGQEVVVHAFSNKLPGKISKLDKLIDSKTLEDKKLKPKKLVENDRAIITIKLEKKVALELYKNNKTMGKIALRAQQENEIGQVEEITIAAGSIEEFIY